jgi:hypothetical protein
VLRVKRQSGEGCKNGRDQNFASIAHMSHQNPLKELCLIEASISFSHTGDAGEVGSIMIEVESDHGGKREHDHLSSNSSDGPALESITVLAGARQHCLGDISISK